MSSQTSVKNLILLIGIFLTLSLFLPITHVHANQPPVATIVSVSPNPADVGVSVTFVFSGSDSDGTAVHYEWDFGDDTTWSSWLDGNDIQEMITHNYSTRGSYAARLRVLDDGEAWSSWTSIVVQVGNQPPVATILSISPNPAVVGAAVTFTGDGSDADGVVVAYQWTSSIDDWLGDSPSFTMSSLSAGIHTISFWVQDNDGVWSDVASDILEVLVGNQPPVATILSISPNPADVGVSVTFVFSGSDSDGTAVHYEWDFGDDTAASGALPGDDESLEVEHVYSAGGGYAARLRVRDDEEAWSSWTLREMEITESVDDEPPSIGIPSYLPEIPSGGAEVDLQVFIGDEVSGVEGATLWYRVSGGAWNEVPMQFGEDTWMATVPAQEEGQLVEFYIDAYDNAGNYAETQIFDYTVTLTSEDSSPSWVIVPVLGGGVAASGAVAYALSRSRPPSSHEIENEVDRKETEEMEKESKEEEDERQKSRKGKPHLVWSVAVPRRIIGSKPMQAVVNIQNRGPAPARDVLITLASPMNVLLARKVEQIPTLKPNEKRRLRFPFKISENAKKGVYDLRFTVKSKETPTQLKRRFLHATKIGLLSRTPRYAEPLKSWLRGQGYTWDDLPGASDYLKLLRYDLILVAPEAEMPPKDVRNLANFVEDGQSLLVVDKIATPAKDTLAKTLGYDTLDYHSFKSRDGTLLVIDNQHAVTRGVGERILLGPSWGNACLSKPSTGQTLAVIQEEQQAIPIIIVNKYGRGKTVHLNFHAEAVVRQLNTILRNSVDWLLSTR
jgi:PKD repeat protein